MALIYRTILQVPDAQFVENAPALFDAWLARKLKTSDVAAIADSLGDQVTVGDIDMEYGRVQDASDEVVGFRGHCYENRDKEEVRLTFTALADAESAWGWIDVERWTSDVHAHAWVSDTPGLVRDLLADHTAYVGSIRLQSEVDEIGPDQAGALADLVADPDRQIAVVVVTPTRREREEEMSPCRSRARELQRKLGGVALVSVLGPGATSRFSQRIIEHAGEGMDVHSGAIRTYLPGVGSPDDRPFRHRVMSFQRIAGRSEASIGRLVALPLQRAACLLPPPPIWREQVLQLPAFSRDVSEDLALTNQVLELAERERDAALDRVAQLTRSLEEEQETVAEVLGQLNGLTGRVRYLQARLTELAPEETYDQPVEETFDAEWCADVVQHAADRCDLLVFSDEVLPAAEELDEHVNRSWARKAWRAFQALQAYAAQKRAGTNGEYDFKRYCEQSGPEAIPGTWVATGESETTENNDRFRRLRTLPVHTDVHADGEIYMPAHIRVQKGGTPCPRIHFHDDTAGTTGKIYIGWFGDHLDSAAKS